MASACGDGEGGYALQLAGVILAGGRGQRLGGVVKAAVPVGGSTLLQRTSTALGARVAPLLVAGGSIAPERLGLEPHHVALPDLPLDYAGPLAGLAAAVEWLRRQPDPPTLLLSLAVDTPFVPSDYAPCLLSALAPGAPGVMVTYDGQDYPTNALWRLEALAGLPAAMAAGTAPRSLRRLAAELGLDRHLWPPHPAGDPFTSVNTPAELAAAEARASAPTDAGGGA